MNETRERRLGAFRLERGGGFSGSQGSVYRAVCEEPFPGVAVGETVALKTMPAGEDPEDGARFRRRVDALMAVRDDHVVRYRGHFSAAGAFQTTDVTVMDWLDGETLRDRLAREPGGLDADVALKVADGLLAGLAAAQAAGLVHRDVKPGNVFLGRDGSVKLIDFEVAHRVAATAQSRSSTAGFAGTFDYMAPEFADPDFRGTAASDVFSAGVVMHEALTGQLPYARKAEKGEQADFAFLSRWSQRKEGLCAIRLKSSVRRVLSHADDVLEKALAEDPGARYPDAAAFREALRQIRYREVRSASDAYRLLRLVGEGGFGCVYKARARGSNRFVAVKQLKRPEFGDRFRREARVMQRLDDPSFVRFVDYFETRDVGAAGAFLVMDFLPGMPGSSLRDAIRGAANAPLPFADVMTAFDRYARALALMHRLRIYHRDIKPSNLYYPHGDPARAAIMDLGIARDVSGTATAGQVPGTLDYMPPEVVLGGSRGDAGMDVYALGLCLYEAVSGETGYPRLPTGPSAFPAFYERVRARRPPSFGASVVTARPQLAALLREMTALDPRERLQDAELLRRRLAAAASETPGVPQARTPDRTELRGAGSPRTVRSARAEAPTGATAGGSADRPAAAQVAPDPAMRRKRMLLTAGGLAAVAVVVLLLAGRPLANGVAAWCAARSARNVEEILARDENQKKAETERLRQQAEREAAEVLTAFAAPDVTAVAADARASAWKIRWRKEPRVAATVAAFDGEFSLARSKRLARDAAEAEKARQTAAAREQSEIVAALRGTNVATQVCDARIAAWRENWRGAVEAAAYSRWENELSVALGARKNRDVKQAQEAADRARNATRRLEKASKAVGEAAAVAAAYGDAGKALAASDAAHEAWRAAWRDVLDLPAVRAASERIAAARKRRAGADAGGAVVAECNRYLDSIPLVGGEEVKNWRNLIDRAAFALRKAEAVGGVSSDQAATLRARIAACRKWVVGVLDNKTDRTVSFGGRTIGPVSSATVVFTNGYPVGVSVTCEGCEPLHVLERNFSGRVCIVMPRDLEERACETRATLPPYGAGILCLVDGIERKPGEIRLRRGRHVVRYWRREETYPGVRDYDPKEFSFETHLAAVAEVPVPKGEWVVSSGFRQARQQKELVTRGRAIEADVRRQLAPLPVETRRARLEKAHARLSDWKTSSALAVLGVGVERELKAAYEAERRRVRGVVSNATASPLTVTTDGAPVVVPPGERKLVTFEREWPSDARAIAPGYEFVMLPREAAAFDGATFEVRTEKLVPLPVRVEVPPVGADVTCRVDGTAVSGTVALRPGDHEAVWSKPDHVAQKFPFAVAFATPRAVPLPGKWQPSGALSGFTAAFRAFNDGAVDAAKRLSEDIGNIEDPARRRELEDLKRAIDLRKKLEEKGGSRK